jgi:hypothetical protein
MINDTVDILDPFIINFGINFIIKPQKNVDKFKVLDECVVALAFIINFGINFIIKPQKNVDKFKVLDECVVALANRFSTPLFIGEPLSKSNIFNVLNEVSGVNDVVKVQIINKTKVQIINKTSANYSNVFFDIEDNTSPDGDYILTPANAIMEMKFPEVDIKGKLR